ncbi:MAG TPA: DUF6455 family protein [Burkholderiales bacterium]|nr:DUF6455 family protein [Burkholderiales bacterium]
MDPVGVVVAGALLAGIVTAAGLINCRLWRAAAGEEGALLFPRMLAREGMRLDDCRNEGTFTQVAIAARRCLLCREHERCVSWLDGRGAIAPGRFCPNADLIAALAAEVRAKARLCARSQRRASTSGAH